VVTVLPEADQASVPEISTTAVCAPQPLCEPLSVPRLVVPLAETATPPAPLSITPNPGLEATFDTAADSLQLLRAEIEASQRFVVVPPISRRPEKFSCLRVNLGPYVLLVPVDQVRRVEEVVKFDRFAGVSLPGLEASNYILLCDGDVPGIYIDGVEGIASIEPEDVIWRRPSHRSPWFVGTHRATLSRIFDPLYFLQQTRISWR